MSFFSERHWVSSALGSSKVLIVYSFTTSHLHKMNELKF